MPLNPKFTTTTPGATGYVWIKQAHSNLANQQALADELAAHVMQSKLPTHQYAAWLNKRNNGTTNAATIAHALEATLFNCIGLQAHPKPDDHCQGWVAEHLWYFLVRGSYNQPSVERLFDVSISSTDPGGDGLVIHRTATGTFLFRLWEIKKITGQTVNVNTVISNASDQLHEKGRFYLSRYVINTQQVELPQDIRVFIDQLMEKWIDESDDAAAGITVVSSTAKLANPSFANLATKFPKFSANNMLEGRTIELVDFEGFCKMVCESLWKGI